MANAATAPIAPPVRSSVGNTPIAWRDLNCRALRISPAAYVVFGALRLHVDAFGYCWPSVKTLIKESCIKKPKTVYLALAKLKNSRLIDKAHMYGSRGEHTVSLYRLGGKIEALPERLRIRGWTLAKPSLLPTKGTGTHLPKNGPRAGTNKGIDPLTKSGNTHVPEMGREKLFQENFDSEGGTCGAESAAVVGTPQTGYLAPLTEMVFKLSVRELRGLRTTLLRTVNDRRMPKVHRDFCEKELQKVERRISSLERKSG
jgi:hypothetical protein